VLVGASGIPLNWCACFRFHRECLIGVAVQIDNSRLTLHFAPPAGHIVACGSPLLLSASFFDLAYSGDVCRLIFLESEEVAAAAAATTSTGESGSSSAIAMADQSETVTRYFFSKCPMEGCSAKVAVCTYPDCSDIAPLMEIVQTVD
jgi:hypothetical protein